MDVSILISTRNNAWRLKETLLHLNCCRIPTAISWEVVVVNHNSNDSTEQVAREMQHVMPLKYAMETREGLGCARNCSLSISSGALVIFTDDDVKPEPGWVEAYWAAYVANPSGRFWGGPVESEFEGVEPNWELVQLGSASIKGLDLGASERGLVDEGALLVAANWACSGAALKRAGGFDSQLGLNTAIGGGEETDLMQRLTQAGVEPWYLPLAKLRHIVPTNRVSLKQMGVRRRAYGRYVAREVNETRKRNVPLLDVPPWVIRTLLETGTAWIFARMTGKSGFAEYLKLQETLGIAEALQNAKSKRHYPRI
jgi:glycosyltransferase involved in cell wall biosynthesis